MGKRMMEVKWSMPRDDEGGKRMNADCGLRI